MVFAPTGTLETFGQNDYDVPVKFRAAYSYHKEDGSQASYVNLTVPDIYKDMKDVRGSGQDFQTIAGQVDTVMLGQNIQFPTCSWGLRDPQVLLRLRTALRNADRQNHTFTDRMRIDCIILKPHEEESAE